ncbi:hypothetical protein [Maribacter sp. 4G9]|uniref:hypothetical protein n=1 Tax=Maribacter sp. 4G9 TaxID=1889777 RepID=UPI000C146F93|nr:hypothetical protein [Maribacter sp. 4G9]PIB31452.1 hypothetical protein BFP75_01510 [Maribacter sp. 4G9]
MALNKGGRKALGDKKRENRIMLRFNNTELLQVKEILRSYNLDYTKRGVIGPFLRRLILNKETADNQKLPDLSANLVFQINKIGVNINQLTAVARSKNLRSPSAKLDAEIEKSNELLGKIVTLLNEKIY